MPDGILNHPSSTGAIDISKAPMRVELNGGEHVPVLIPTRTFRGKQVTVTSNASCFIKGSVDPDIKGVDLTSGDDAISTSLVDFDATSFTALDAGTGDFSFVCCMSIRGDVASDNRPFMLGTNSGGTAYKGTILVVDDVITGMKLVVTSDDGTDLFDETSADLSGFNYAVSEQMRNFTYSVDIANTLLEFYIDGAKVAENSLTVDGDTVNISSLTSGRLGFGATFGNANIIDSVYNSFRFYKSALTATQVAARCNAGPIEEPDDGITPAAVLNFQNRGSWADDQEPEIVDSDGAALIALDNIIGDLDFDTDIVDIEGYTVASMYSSAEILAHTPTNIFIPQELDYIVLYSRPETAAVVMIAETV